jgi:DNA replication protein DnaC
LRALKLPTFKREYAKLARECGAGGGPYEAYLEQLARLELENRESSAIARRLKEGSFPLVKELRNAAEITSRDYVTAGRAR